MGNDGTWLSTHKQYFEPGMLGWGADWYFSAIWPLMNWEAFNFDGPVLSSASYSYSYMACPLIQSELYEALALEFSGLCWLLEKMNWFTLKWTWGFCSHDGGDGSCQHKRMVSASSGDWITTYWVASNLGRETGTLKANKKPCCVFFNLKEVRQLSDFERVKTVCHFLQIPGIYTAFILGIFYGFENSANIISFFNSRKKSSLNIVEMPITGVRLKIRSEPAHSFLWQVYMHSSCFASC